jgi:hypothetical protein
MDGGTVKEAERTRSSDELARLRRELEEARTRLEEETAYYRAELENTRQRVEKQNVREHAEEVSKRRRVEEQVLALKAELRQAQSELERARTGSEELVRQLAEQEQIAGARADSEIAKVKAAAKAAWKSAEEEVARAEHDHVATKQELAQAQERLTALEAELERARKGAASESSAESQRLIASLKKALWETAQARRRAEVQLAVLQAGGPQAQDAGAAINLAQPAPPTAPGLPSGDSIYRELKLDDLKALNFGDMHNDFSDEFLLMPGDASLDAETFQKLQTLSEELPPAEAAPVDKPKPAPKPVAKKVSEPVYQAPPQQAEEVPLRWVDCSRHGLGRVLRNLTIGVGATGAVYWLFESGLVAQLLEMVR